MKVLVQCSGWHLHLSDGNLAQVSRAITPATELTVAGEYVAEQRAEILSGPLFGQNVALHYGLPRAVTVLELDSDRAPLVPADADLWDVLATPGWLKVTLQVVGVIFRAAIMAQGTHAHIDPAATWRSTGDTVLWQPRGRAEAYTLPVKRHRLNRTALPAGHRDCDGVIHLEPAEYRRLYGASRAVIVERCSFVTQII
jgi:hypothetical protein